jgi:Mrp family chromosome partitioning ATPase
MNISKNFSIDKTHNRLIFIVGHYGSGKTEFAVNLALAMSASLSPVSLADLDIVNPYFRSRERKALLEENGVRLIASSSMHPEADLPSIPAEVLSVIQNDGALAIIDAGGDAAGARVLARYRQALKDAPHAVLFVYNASRPQARHADDAARYIQSIEGASGLRVTGIVNNTHLCEKTTPEVVLRGIGPARDVSRRTGLPIVCHVVRRSFLPALAGVDEAFFPIEILMKKPWE